MELTYEQTVICDAVEASSQSLIIQAGPGCGKTFTNVETMKRSGYGHKMALAYNRSIADELKLKVPPGIKVQTTHAAGYAMMKSRFKSKLNTASPYAKTSKTYKIVQRAFPNKFSSNFQDISAALVMGMDKYGLGADGPTNPSDWVSVLEDCPMDADDRREVSDRLPAALTKLLEETEEITFSEMLISPLVYDLEPQFPQNRIWGDEIQDWSHVQLKLVSKLAGPNTLFYGFGDTYQSIYAFRGADIHAMDRFQETFHAQGFPLTTSFRCPLSVIELARNRNPDLTCPEGTPDGTVGHLDSLSINDCDDETMVLCRLNAPLFSFGLKFLAAGRKVRVSSNIGATLINIIRAARTDDMRLLRERLEAWYEDQLDFAKDTPHLKGAAMDKYNALINIYAESDSVADMISNIERLTKGSTGPLLSTVHKAKGLEAPKVILLKSNLFTWPGETVLFNQRELTEEEAAQEWNIWFVAVTRSMDQLYFA
jgi:hypothetical protein